jgi:class 3 adenylate cyclase/tetratricopeptide (TPR) repeat protein
MSMACANCAHENPEGARFCSHCGSPLAQACANCATPLAAGARFCSSCGTPVEQAGAPAPAQPTAMERLSQYIPPELLAKLETARTGGGGMQGERRVVTMLFCDVKGSTAAAERLDPEDWAEIMNGAFEVLIAPVYRFEGTLARLMGDAILAFFGAPVAHEDDPQRAVLAGLEILEAVGPFRERVRARWGVDFDVRVGINTGLVVVGEVGSDLRVEYTALGDAVNLAARMEQTATPGTVQITAGTQRLIGPLFECEEVGGIEVKGKAEPVTAYRVLRPKEQPGSLRGVEGLSSPLVGRGAEMDRLREALASVRRGSGGIVTVMGEAGLGKSRLLAEARAEALSEPGLDWYEGRSLSYQLASPYAPFISMLGPVLGLRAGMSEAERFAAVRAGAGRIAPEQAEAISPYLASMLGVPLPESAQEAVRYLEAAELRNRTFGAVKALVGAMAAHRPTVLVLDDVHWADETSLALLEHLMPAADTCMLALVALMRPERTEPSWRFHEAAQRDFEHRYTAITLNPLTGEQSGELLGRLLTEVHLPPRLRALVEEKAEGIPFYVEEVLRTLIDGDVLTQRDGHWALTDPAVQVEVPESLNALLTARLDRLDEPVKRLAQTAAVIGREFARDVLAAVAAEPPELDTQLTTLQRRGIIRETARVPQRVFSFKHSLIQEAAEASLLNRNRRELHRRTATWLQEHAPQGTAGIARHLDEAQAWEEALPYLAAAGDGAAGSFSMPEAIHWYRRALEVLALVERESGPQVALSRRVHEGLGHALLFSSRPAEAAEVYAAMQSYAREQGDQPMLVSSLNKAALVHAMGFGDSDAALVDLAAAEEAASEVSTLSGLAETNMIHCYIRTTAGDLEEAYDRLQQAAALGRQLDEVEPRLFGMVHVVNTLNYMTRFEEARREADAALALAKEVGHLGWESELYALSFPTMLMAEGSLQEAESMARRGMALAERIGSAEREAAGALLAGMICRMRGAYPEALTLSRRAVAAARASGAAFMEAAALSEEGMVCFEVGGQHLPEVDPLHQTALERLGAPLGTAMGSIVWANVGFCALGRGELDTARRMLERARTQPTGLRLFVRPQVLLGEGLLRLAEGDGAGARDALQEAHREAEARGLRFMAPMVHLGTGMVLANLGDASGAAIAFTQAAEGAESLGMRPAAWQARAGLAGALATSGDAQAAAVERERARAGVEQVAAGLTEPADQAAYIAAAIAAL